MGHHFFTAEFSRLQRRIAARADVAELADASDLGSGTLQCAGSSPVIRTKKKMKRTKGFGPLVRFLY